MPIEAFKKVEAKNETITAHIEDYLVSLQGIGTGLKREKKKRFP